MIKGHLDDQMVKLTSMYVPNSGQIDFLKEVLDKIDVFKEGTLIVAGTIDIIKERAGVVEH